MLYVQRSPEPKASQTRPGVVLLMVLVVVVLLSLAAYQYYDLMVAEYKAADNYHKAAQVRAFAESGVHYAAAMLSAPDAAALLNGNFYDNPEAFRNIEVGSGNDKKAAPGRFSLIAPLDPEATSSGGPCAYGVIDEGGKINLNGIMKRDPSGQTLHDMLMKLPNMTAEIAGAIVDWVDADSIPFAGGGAENDYYSGLSPSYRCKNGPLDSIDELLLVKGVTPELLYGDDRNRNGMQDADENSSEGGFSRGWSAFLTIYSREANVDSQGLAYTFLNDSELETLFEKLAPAVGDDLAKFIILYRQYGPSNSSGRQQTMGSTLMSLFTGGKGKTSNSQTKTVPGKLSDFTPDFTSKPRQSIKSLYDLVTSQVTVPNKDSKQPSTLYTSPLADPGMARDLLPKLFEHATVFEESELPARINVNTAPYEVLAALPELTETDVQNILGRRPKMSSGDGSNAIYQTPAWLVLEAGLNPTTLSKLEKVITTRSQVYSVQALGYFEDGKGPVARVQAVIDINAGRPRILAFRDVSDLGRSRVPQ